MPIISDIQVKYGTSLAPPGYHRVGLFGSEETSANINPNGPTKTSLWTVENKGPGISDVIVLSGENDHLPQGFKKVPKALNTGIEGSVPLFLAFKSVTDNELEEKKLICELIISHGDKIPGNFKCYFYNINAFQCTFLTFSLPIPLFYVYHV